MTWDVRFTRKDCTPGPHRAQCTRAKKEPRIVGLQAREPYEARQEARQRQTTKEFRQQYAPRAGIESTHAQGIRRCGLRQARYMGQAKTHLQHLATAAALNCVRIGEWLAGTPRAKTRGSPLAPSRQRRNSPPVSRSVSPGAISTAEPVRLQGNGSFPCSLSPVKKSSTWLPRDS
jgi:transposase